MGMFDRIYADCPTCCKPMEFQTKAGDCVMDSFSLEDAPGPLLRDVINDPHYCRHCDQWAVLYDPAFPPNVEPPAPTPTIRKVRQPTKPSIHSSQPYLRWWDEPFVETDLTSE